MRLLLASALVLVLGCGGPSQKAVEAPVGHASKEQQETAGAVPAMWPLEVTSLVDAEGKPFALAPLWQEEAAIIVFYRGHWCAYCVKQLAELQDELDDIQECGLKVVGISADGPDESRALRDRLDLGFPLLSDPDLRVMEALGVRHPGQQFARPATLIVRPGGTIVYSYVGLNPSDRPPVDHILAANGCDD